MAAKEKLEKNREKEEHLLARKQRQELKEELTENFAQRPRMPGNRRRIITFSVLGAIALLVIIFGVFVLLPASPEQPHGGIAVAQAAPGFNLPIQGGLGTGNISLRALYGHPVVLNFWSESCLPCLSEVPYLRGIYAQKNVADEFRLVGIDQSDPRDDIRTFGQTYHVNYPLLYDAGSKTNIAYGATLLPMTYFIDSKGIVRYVVAQQLTPDAMQKGLAAIGVTLT